MIQTILAFVLGFLVASALALLTAPFVWRRAELLAKRRFEASIPTSREELSAEIDALKAEHAMSMRRLEMKAEAIKKKAAQDFVEINKQREEIERLRRDCSERDEAIRERNAEREKIEQRFAKGENEIRVLGAKLAETRTALAERMSEVEDLSRHYEQASLTSSGLQVELAAKEGEVERLNDTVRQLRTEKKDLERQKREALMEKGRAEEVLKGERHRAQTLERKLEQLMRSLYTAEEKADRQEKDLMRLRGVDADAAVSDEPADAGIVPGPVEEEGELADGDIEANEGPQVERMRERLTRLARENRRLRNEVASSSAGDEALRNQIASLAAEVVGMTAALEGADSPIEAALSLPIPDVDDEQPVERPISLADRVRALRLRESQ